MLTAGNSTANIGYVFLNNERTSFRGAVGVTYTDEQYTVEDDRDGSFFGARLGWDFRQKLFENTTFTHTLIADENLEVCRHRLGACLALEGTLAREHLVEHDAREKMSEWWSAGRPRTCSGDM